MARSSAPNASENRFRQWHRLFGLLLTDYLADSPFTVEIERDLSKRVQRLDVVVVRRRPGAMTRPLPDGLSDFVDHNLISFKSFQEPLNDWALKELTGHYVNYRKQVSPRGEMIPESEFGLYAVCARHPRDLFRVVVPEKQQDGVYSVRRGTDVFRIVVARELAQSERNALLHLFSASPAQVQYGAEHYRLQSQETSSIVDDLIREYQHEGLSMPYTMADFKRDYARRVLAEMTAEERLAGLNPEERLAGLNPEERLAGLSRDQIEAYLRNLKPRRADSSKRSRKKGR